jgi:hypothetical protein
MAQFEVTTELATLQVFTDVNLSQEQRDWVLDTIESFYAAFGERSQPSGPIFHIEYPDGVLPCTDSGGDL